MILPAFVWVVCTLGADAVERRPVDDDMDEFLDAVNEAGQLYGIAYMEYPYGVLFADSAFSGLKIGELTSWQRKGEAYATGDSLQDFTVDAVVGLQVFQVLVANFSSGDYSGKMSILFLDNACSLRTYNHKKSLRRKMASKRRNMFQKNKTQETTENGCKVNVTSVSFTALGNARFYSEDLLASSLLLEKKYISEEFRTALLGETLGSMVQVVFEESMDAYMCKGRSELVDKLKRILPFIREESDQIAAQSAL